MRVGFPHMGNLYVALGAMLQRLDMDYVIPPPTSQRTLALGVRHSPEGLCIPFKLTLGNLIEAAELGADTWLMPAGYGICRLGYYAKTQEQILQDIGYGHVNVVGIGVSQDKLSGLLRTVKSLSNNASWLKIISAFRFGLSKMSAMDRLERLTQKVRAVELAKGTASALLVQGVKEIDHADDYRTLKKVEKDYAEQLGQVPVDEQIKPLVVGVIGEFYVVLEPFSSFDIESELGKLGVEVRRSTFISGWTKLSYLFNPFAAKEKDRIHRAAMPYLKRDVGGDGWESVGEKVLHAGSYDGIVHLAPFTCMPEIIARNIMPRTKEDIPVLTVLCDEQMAKTGLVTRLEAFVDLLARRRRRDYNR
ncbi:MAG: CoA protein activase [Chloroflexi bacterium]|nr:CoA protein activase [Chloroflexota bacterium]